MKTIYLLIFVIFFLKPHPSYGQEKSFYIEGKITDSSNNTPVIYAAITILSDTLVTHTFSNEKGFFKLIFNDAGNKKIRIEALGYKVFQDTLNLIDSAIHHLFLSIKLQPNPKTLKEVVIQSPQLTFKAGKLIYTVKDIDIKTSVNANDILGNVPYLFTDADGTVYLTGKGKAEIYLNGKPLLDNTVLKSLPADLVKQVEVLTNLGAKYGENKVNGVVNIITKDWLGSYGTISAAVGTNETSSANAYFSAKGKKTEINVNAGLNYYNRPFNSNLTTYNYNQQTTLYQNIDKQNKGVSPYINVGINFLLNTTSTISCSGNLYSPQFFDDGNISYSLFDASMQIKDYSKLNSSVRIKNLSFKNYLDYTKIFKDHSKLLISAQLLNNKTNNITRNNTLSPSQQNIISNYPKLNESTLQLDYTNQNSTKAIHYNIGGKWIYRENLSDYYVDTFNTSLKKYERDYSFNQSNHFFGSQNIFSAYGTISMNKKNFSGNLSIANELTSEKIINIRNDYFNFLPLLSLSYKINNNNNLRFDFNNQIERPGIYYLNPFIDTKDPKNIITGNPFLKPENYNSYSINYDFQKGTSAFNFSLYYNDKRNIIDLITHQYVNDTLIGKYENIGKGEDAGISLYLSFLIKNRLKFSSTIGLEKNQLYGFNLINKGYSYYSNVNLSYLISKVFSFRGSFNYNSSYISLQGENPAISSSEFSLRSKFFKNKLILSLNASDLFTINSKRISHLKTMDFNHRTVTNLNLRYFSFQVFLNLGKVKYSTNTQVKINNSDLLNKSF